MKKSILMVLMGVFMGFLVGRIVPPRKPTNWSKVQVGMHYSGVYQAVPKLEGGMREVKGLDTCTAEFGNSYWQLFVYYDDTGRVNGIKTKLFW